MRSLNNLWKNYYIQKIYLSLHYVKLQEMSNVITILEMTLGGSIYKKICQEQQQNRF